MDQMPPLGQRAYRKINAASPPNKRKPMLYPATKSESTSNKGMKINAPINAKKVMVPRDISPPQPVMEE